MLSLQKDTDREILLKLSDEDLLNACKVSKYFRNTVCDENFFMKRLQLTYSNTIQFKVNDQSWKQYFLETIYCISKLKEDYKFEYTIGNVENPKDLYILTSINSFGLNPANTEKINYQMGAIISVRRGNIYMLKLLLEKRANYFNIGNLSYIMKEAAKNGYLHIVKLMVEKGVTDFDRAIREAKRTKQMNIVQYLENQK